MEILHPHTHDLSLVAKDRTKLKLLRDSLNKLQFFLSTSTSNSRQPRTLFTLLAVLFLPSSWLSDFFFFFSIQRFFFCCYYPHFRENAARDFSIVFLFFVFTEKWMKIAIRNQATNFSFSSTLAPFFDLIYRDVIVD